MASTASGVLVFLTLGVNEDRSLSVRLFEEERTRLLLLMMLLPLLLLDVGGEGRIGRT